MPFHYLPGTPPARSAPSQQQADIPPGSLTLTQADQYVTELTRAQVTASVAQCDMQIAAWQQKVPMLHDINLYIDAAKAQKQAIPITDKDDPTHLANEARRLGLAKQIDQWQLMKDAWQDAQEHIDAIQKRRDASATYLATMPPVPSDLVGYPIPTPPLVSFAEESANWPPAHVDPALQR
jgi:hypothetical protein